MLILWALLPTTQIHATGLYHLSEYFFRDFVKTEIYKIPGDYFFPR